MKTIVVDDEYFGLERFKDECVGVEDIELVGEFSNPLAALECAKQKWIDLAFLDIEMPQMSGLDLSDSLREINPDMIVIFLSAYDQYMADAFGKRGADYYLVKPYTKTEILSVVKRAKLLSKRFAKRIYIETFGRFTVYLDGKPLPIASEDAKEILALLVDRRGAVMSNQELFDVIWPSRNYNDTSAIALYKALRRLKDTLDKAGIGDLLVKVSLSEYKINTDLIDCDFYQFLADDPVAMQKFAGKYMDNWSWGSTAIMSIKKMKKAAYAHLTFE